MLHGQFGQKHEMISLRSRGIVSGVNYCSVSHSEHHGTELLEAMYVGISIKVTKLVISQAFWYQAVWDTIVEIDRMHHSSHVGTKFFYRLL